MMMEEMTTQVMTLLVLRNQAKAMPAMELMKTTTQQATVRSHKMNQMVTTTQLRKRQVMTLLVLRIQAKTMPALQVVMKTTTQQATMKSHKINQMVMMAQLRKREYLRRTLAARPVQTK